MRLCQTWDPTDLILFALMLGGHERRRRSLFSAVIFRVDAGLDLARCFHRLWSDGECNQPTWDLPWMFSMRTPGQRGIVKSAASLPNAAQTKALVIAMSTKDGRHLGRAAVSPSRLRVQVT